MQLAAARGAVGKQAFEKLHGGSYHHGHIPVFRCQPQLVFAVFALQPGIVEAAVVFQHRRFAQRSKRFAKLGGVLLDDAGERNHINHAAQTVRLGVFQRERHRREGFAAAGGHGEAEQPRVLLRLRHGIIQNFAAQAVQCGIALLLFRFLRGLGGTPSERVDKIKKNRPQRLQIGMAAAHGFALFQLGVKGFGVEKIGIDQTGIQHTDEKSAGEMRMVASIGFHRRRRQRFGQIDFLPPNFIELGNIRTKLPVQPLLQSAAPVTRACAVCQPGMVPRNAERHHLAQPHAPAFNRDFRARRGMVHPLRVAVQTFVKQRRILAHVVQQPSGAGNFLRAEIRGKARRHPSHIARVAFHRLPMFVGQVSGGVGVVGF